MSEIIVKIESLGAGGDGVATGPDGAPLYVPMTLPGETVLVAREGDSTRPVRIVEPSGERVKPVCSHFARCGGCSLQHWRDENYRAWKRAQLAITLAARGLDLTQTGTRFEALQRGENGTRRRAVFSATRTRKSVLLGYYKRADREIVDITRCPVLDDRIVEALPALRKLVRVMLSRRNIARISVLATRGGLDIVIDDVPPLTDPARRIEVTERSSELKLARLGVAGECIIERDKALIAFDGLPALPPAGGFLQASEVMQDHMIRHVLALTKDFPGGRVVDLFGGMGTFSLPLARRFQVLAVEYDRAALAALQRSAALSKGLKPVETLERDLTEMPLSVRELKGYDVALFDPPRAGALAQVSELAGSDIPVLIAISCNPATFARDARILVDGGYRLKSLKPFDPFLYSPHVELIAEFVKE